MKNIYHSIILLVVFASVFIHIRYRSFFFQVAQKHDEFNAKTLLLAHVRRQKNGMIWYREKTDCRHQVFAFSNNFSWYDLLTPAEKNYLRFLRFSYAFLHEWFFSIPKTVEKKEKQEEHKGKRNPKFVLGQSKKLYNLCYLYRYRVRFCSTQNPLANSI